MGGYDEHIGIQDFQITLKVAYAGYYVDCLPDTLTLYRDHAGSLSKRYKFEHLQDLQAIKPYEGHKEYKKAQVALRVKALKRAVVDDKRYAWKLILKIPLRFWDKKILRRLRYLIFK